eukprot:1975151-Amphidinium_carterae.1
MVHVGHPFAVGTRPSAEPLNTYTVLNPPSVASLVPLSSISVLYHCVRTFATCSQPSCTCAQVDNKRTVITSGKTLQACAVAFFPGVTSRCACIE